LCNIGRHLEEADRLGHPLFGSLFTLSTSCGFKLNKDSFRCYDVCNRARQTRSSFSLSNSRADKPFSFSHCDLWGQYHTSTLSSCHYFLCIVDDFHGAIWVFYLKLKLKPTIGLWISVLWREPNLVGLLNESAVTMAKNLPISHYKLILGRMELCMRLLVLTHLNKMVGLNERTDTS